MFPPKLIKPYVVSFCRTVVREPVLEFVPVRPRATAEVLSCFTTVPLQVQEHGGQVIVGWAIWEWPDVVIEAEYHAVWQSPDGQLVDVTPKDPPVKRVLFLRDPFRPYEGFQRDNFRKALRRDKDVDRLIELGRLIHDELNRGDLKFRHGDDVPVREAYAVFSRERAEVAGRLRERYGDKLRAVALHSLS